MQLATLVSDTKVCASTGSTTTLLVFVIAVILCVPLLAELAEPVTTIKSPTFEFAKGADVAVSSIVLSVELNVRVLFVALTQL